jgi:hypothetical protein
MQQLLMLRVVQTLPLVMTVPCFAGLANIAGDGPNARDVVLAAEVMQVVGYSQHFGCVSPPHSCHVISCPCSFSSSFLPALR